MKKQRVNVVRREADGHLILNVEYPTIGKSFTTDLNGFSDLIRECAMIHGFKQKFGDAASGCSPTEKYAMVQRINDSLLNEEWELTAVQDRTPLIVEALVRMKKIKVEMREDVAFIVDPKTGKSRPAADMVEKIKEWGTNSKVRATILKLQAEKAEKAAKSSDDDEVTVDFEDEDE